MGYKIIHILNNLAYLVISSIIAQAIYKMYQLVIMSFTVTDNSTKEANVKVMFS